MITVYSQDHKLRNAKTELSGGELVAPFECPSRAQFIIERVIQCQLGEIQAPLDFGLKPILKVHDQGFVMFLSKAWKLWSDQNNNGEAIATCWPARRMSQRKPTDIEGLLGYYSLAAETSISPGTWEAVQASANVALGGAQLIINNHQSVFSLCRPPGHHAAIDM